MASHLARVDATKRHVPAPILAAPMGATEPSPAPRATLKQRYAIPRQTSAVINTSALIPSCRRPLRRKFYLPILFAAMFPMTPACPRVRPFPVADVPRRRCPITRAITAKDHGVSANAIPIHVPVRRRKYIPIMAVERP